MRHRIQSLWANDYLRNIGITGLGVGISAALGFVTAPIISRLFTPGAYGMAGLYTSTLAIGGLLMSGMFPTALVVARQKRDVYRLIGGIQFLWWIGVSLSIMLVVFAKKPIQNLLGDTSNGWWLYLLPLGLLFSGITQLVGALNTRAAMFTIQSKGSVGGSLLNKLGNVLGGWLSQGHYLVLIITSLLTIVPRLWVQPWGAVQKVARIQPSFADFRYLLQHFREYPLFLLPANLLNALALQAPFLLIAHFLGLNTAGQYLFGQTLLQMGIILVGNSIQPVYLQKATQTYFDERETFIKTTNTTLQNLFLLGLAPLSVLTVFGQQVIVFFLGNNWDQAGIVVQYLSLYYLFRLSTFPFTAIYRVTKKEKRSLQTQIVLFVLRLGPLWIGLYFFQLETALLLLAVGGILGYWFLFHQLMEIARLPFWSVLAKQLGLLVISLGVLFVLKYLIFGL